MKTIKMMLLIIPMILLVGCEITIDEDKADNQVIEECEKNGGKAIIKYCRNSEKICGVSCEVEE